MPFLQGYVYPVEDLQPLHDLLKEWNLECTYQTLLDELIDLKILAIMKVDYHTNELLKNYPLGIKILFSNNLEKWQNSKKSSSMTSLLPTTLDKKLSQEKLSSAISINLGEILNECSTGLMINDYYKTNHKFNDNIRTLLVDTIINYVITKKISMSVALANSIADQIADIFPTEVKDSYFLKYDTNKNPKGKLYAKYYNSMRTLKNSGLIPSSNHTKRPTNPINRKHDLHFEPENDVQYILEQIKHDNNCSFPDLEYNWKATTQFRLKSIQTSTSTHDILNNWSNYKLPLGYRLVDIDFNTMYPSCSNLISTFEEKSEKIINLLDEKIKDTLSRRLFESLNEPTADISQNGKNTIIFYLLHAIFIPTSIKVTRDHTGKKNQTKYSIKDSQNSFIVFKNSLVPTPMNPQEIIVYFDSIKYKVFSILHAIDVTFKLFHLFNLEYPPQSVLVWLFIQKFFFSINTKFDVPCHTLGQIMSDLNN
ncbi:unnamed protein product [Macrosiphum euphorbiae]|uniref:DNA-directed DNA polymerase n=1 Tax=Macrosiphum euphorbiae TaxID=13131 RepID=A0AAV0VSN6_9HEMI|nr:unnamed protein product [Macrosiphum euphorbiae]